MSATVNGIVEPEVVGLEPNERPSVASSVGKTAAAGAAIGSTGAVVGAGVIAGIQTAAALASVGVGTGTALGVGAVAGSSVAFGAAAGSVVPVLGTIIGAVAGAIAAAVAAIGETFGATSPDDARRFLYEIGYEPGTTLHTAKVVKAVSARDMAAIQAARYIEISDRDNYGLDTVNGWLEKAGETTGKPSENPMPRSTFFANMAEAYIIAEIAVLSGRFLLSTGQSDVEVPTPAAQAAKGLPLHKAIIKKLRSDEDYAKATLHALAMLAGGKAWSARLAFTRWISRVQMQAQDKGTNPLAMLDYESSIKPHISRPSGTEWLVVGAASTLVVGAAGFASRSRDMSDKKINAPTIGLVLGGVAAASVFGWLLLSPSEQPIQNSAAVAETPLERVMNGRVGQSATKNGEPMMVGPDGVFVPIEGDIRQTRIKYGLMGQTVMVGGSYWVIQPDGSLKIADMNANIKASIDKAVAEARSGSSATLADKDAAALQGMKDSLASLQR